MIVILILGLSGNPFLNIQMTSESIVDAERAFQVEEIAVLQGLCQKVTWHIWKAIKGLSNSYIEFFSGFFFPF